MKSKAFSPIVVDEPYKIRMVKLVESFRESDVQEMTLPDLNNHERRYIHEVARKYGLKTKSKGDEPNRVITVSKPVLVSQPALPMTLSRSSQTVLEEYFIKHPVSPLEASFVISPQLFGAPNLLHTPSHNKNNNSNADRGKKPDVYHPLSNPPAAQSPEQSTLPIFAHKEEIVSKIANNQVTIISGDTGSGKSTQVVQYILDANPHHRIVCTQPRRLPCTSLAARVSEERHGSVGEEVGYSVRFDSKYKDRETRLLFCTSGIALMKLRGESGSGGGGLFDQITHLFLDEVHDRDVNTDFLLVFCKEILAKQKEIKLVLMSATLSVQSFIDYFAVMDCASVSVSGRSFPVTSLFLDDVLHLCHKLPLKKAGDKEEEQERRHSLEKEVLVCPLCHADNFDTLAALGIHVSTCTTANQDMWVDVWDDDNKIGLSLSPMPVVDSGVSSIPAAQKSVDLISDYLLSREDETEVDLDLVVSLLEQICLTVKTPSFFTGSPSSAVKGGKNATSILIFLPGWHEIKTLLDMLSQHALFGNSTQFSLLPLHSGVSHKEQQRVFAASRATKIICSTNIAETSVTIPDIAFVIDTCVMKEKTFDVHSNSSSLQPCFVSRSNAKQRRGRAGRCQEGVCFHLITKARFQALAEFQVPEILRTPLEQLCLQARSMLAVHEFASLADLLSKAMDPPLARNVDRALWNLHTLGALDEEENLTALGRELVKLPLDPVRGRMVLMGSFLGCLDAASTWAVSSGFRDIFVLDFQPGQANGGVSSNKHNKLLLCKSIPDLGVSDHAAILTSVRTYEKGNKEFCSRMGLSSNVLESLKQMKDQLKHAVGKWTFTAKVVNQTSKVLQAIVCLAAGPSNVCVYRGDQRFLCGKHAKVRLHPGSGHVVDKHSLDGTLFVFEEMVRNHTGTCSLRVMTKIDPLVLCLFGGQWGLQPTTTSRQVDEDVVDNTFRVDDSLIHVNAHIKFSGLSFRDMQHLGVLRLRLETSLFNAMERGRFVEEDYAVAQTVVNVLRY